MDETIALSSDPSETREGKDLKKLVEESRMKYANLFNAIAADGNTLAVVTYRENKASIPSYEKPEKAFAVSEMIKSEMEEKGVTPNLARRANGIIGRVLGGEEISLEEESFLREYFETIKKIFSALEEKEVTAADF